MKKITYIIITICMIGILMNTKTAECKTKNYDAKKYDDNRWKTILEDYKDTDTDRLIFVKYISGSRATVEMWKKTTISYNDENDVDNEDDLVNENNQDNDNKEVREDYEWKKILSTKAYVGLNGLYKTKQGDMKTPVGVYNITMAFGIKKSPGTAGIEYTKLNKYHYWSDEKATYNKFVDVRDINRTWIDGEHLINCTPWYNYALALDYNKKCTYLKGSAIFIHCEGRGRKYTHGCIAVPKTKMKKIVKNTTDNTKICIYKK